MPHLEISKVVLVHCNIVSNDYQQDSRVLHAFVSDKSFAQLLDISPKKISKPLIRNFHILKYALPIKTITR